MSEISAEKSKDQSEGRQPEDRAIDISNSSILTDFSKLKHSAERKQTAARILESRKLKREREAKLNELLEADQGLSELNAKLQDLGNNFLNRWMNFL